MTNKAIALFSGGLDGMLAVKVIRDQNISVLGITFETPFFNARKAQETAAQIQLPLRTVDITSRHLVMLKSPRYGYGRNMNPCIDCHTLMLNAAGQIMEETGADFMFTGEVLGQRPMSQTKQSLYIVAKNSGYGEYVVRPLSALLLPETKPEKDGKINRQQLLALQGRGRKRQMEMAKNYGINYYPPPAGGCLLTDPTFSIRMKDLFSHNPDYTVRDIELLKYGRHFRISASIKIIVGRNKSDNIALQELSRNGDAILRTIHIPGPYVLIPGGGTEEEIMQAARLCVLYSDARKDQETTIEISISGKTSHASFSAAGQREALDWIIKSEKE